MIVGLVDMGNMDIAWHHHSGDFNILIINIYLLAFLVC